MENKPTFVPVVAAVIRDRVGRLLLQQCPAHKRHAGKWEFPGGKVETGETPRFALCREVAEELALELDPAAMEPAGFAEEEPVGGRPRVVLFLYTCPVWRGEPEAREGQRWGWFAPDEARLLPLAEMDRALFARLRPPPPG